VYQTSSKNLGMEWSRNSKLNGNFKVNTWLSFVCFLASCWILVLN
jgi:hypothetical protein